MVRYGLTIFLGAFLLFQIQPLAAKLLLPEFGGVAAVWTTAMVFFQLVLLGGYAFVHGLQRIGGPRTVYAVQVGLLCLAAATLPISTSGWAPPWESNFLAWPVATRLASQVGAVFFVIATTGPLVQLWQAQTHPARSPFRLYALSNFGSLLGLVSYPLWVEPLLGLHRQTWLWSLGYVVYAILMIASGWQTVSQGRWQIVEAKNAPAARVPSAQISVWLLLTALASAILMATTNLLCQEVASFPFLWVLPLTVYLLTWMICFERPEWYRRRPCVLVLYVSGLGCLILFHLGTSAALIWHVWAFPTFCFAAGMICHGELERRKPARQNLTLFFLVVSLGGLLGSVLVVLVMPQVFTRFFEFHFLLILVLFLAMLATGRGLARRHGSFGWQAGGWIFSGLFVVLIAGSSLWYSIAADQRNGILARRRSEYGLVAVSDNQVFREMINGQTRHGRQFHDTRKAHQPIDYYDPQTGVGIAFEYLHQKSQPDGKLKTGVIGLGGGVLATWLRPGDSMRFYEINPQVVELARTYFTYLDDAAGVTEIVIGDARIELERELRQGSQQFDLLIVDAFTSDSIPVHLLTREGLAVYWQHLQADGVLALHVSNRYLNLLPVAWDAGQSAGVNALLFERRSQNPDVQECTWVLLTRRTDEDFQPMVAARATPWPALTPVVWTDDLNSVGPLIDWSFWVDWSTLRDERAGGGR